MHMVQSLANRLITARSRKQPLSTDDCAALQISNRSEAYAVQAAVWQIQQGNTRPQAWKIGNSADDAEPVRAAMPEVIPSGSGTPQARFRRFGIEAEIAVRFAHALPPRATPYTYADVIAAIGSTHVAIEIVDTALADHAAAGPFLRLADNMLHGSFVLGAALNEGRKLEWATLLAQSYVDGQLIAAQTGGHPHGDPFTLLPWWVNSGATDWGGVQAGDIVTTGTWNGMHFVEAPASFEVRFNDANGITLGGARVAFT